jgi:hypothetical protein
MTWVDITILYEISYSREQDFRRVIDVGQINRIENPGISENILNTNCETLH